MLRPKSTISVVTPKSVFALAVLCLMSAAILGLHNSYKVDVLRADLANANTALDAAEHRRVTQETELKTRETAGARAEAKIAEAENEAAKAGAEVAQLQKEKTELQTKLEANQNEIASLQKRIDEGGTAARPSENPSAASMPKLQFTAPLASVEINPGAASTHKQPTPPPPSPEIKPEHVEETTPPPPQPKRQKIAPIKAISWAKALATYAPPPQYPEKARLDGITGSGVCVVSVDPQSGNVTEASMAQGTGNPILDDSAVRTFRKWRFKPGTVSRVRIPIEFR
jgi:TonB family protein